MRQDISGLSTPMVSETSRAVARDARQKGLRWTKPRSLITRVFFEASGHVTVEDLFRRIREQEPRIGLATVYRTLNILVKFGYARELNFEDGLIRYEPRGRLKPHHDHLICIRCGKTIEFFSEELEKLQFDAAQAQKFVMTNHRLDIFGYCRDCDKGETNPEGNAEVK